MGIVPIDQRRPMWHFGGLWTTFVAGFWFMVPCFVMYDGGYSLVIAMGTAALGYGLYVAYALADRKTLALLTWGVRPAGFMAGVPIRPDLGAGVVGAAC